MKNDVFPLPNVPGYIDVKEAARLLGVAESSVYRYIQAGRLQAYQLGRSIVVDLETLKQFKPNLTGRPRKKAALWHASPETSSFLVTYIRVQVLNGQQEKLLLRLATIKQEEKHLFPGTVVRYVSIDDAQPPIVTIQLVWRNSEAMSEEKRLSDLDAFKQDLADVLDWETAEYNTGKVLIHT